VLLGHGYNIMNVEIKQHIHKQPEFPRRILPFGKWPVINYLWDMAERASTLDASLTGWQHRNNLSCQHERTETSPKKARNEINE
jgi:hypothetical protein